MIKSMTGYGCSRLEDEILIQTWEIKSFNSKQLNIKFHIPRYLTKIETLLEQKIKLYAKRGKIDVFLNFKILKPDLLPVSFDLITANSMIMQLKNFAQSRGEEFTIDYNIFLSSPRFWIEQETEVESLQERLVNGLTLAIEDWDKSRIEEGQKLREDLLTRVEVLRNILKKIKDRTPIVLKTKWETLQKRVNDLLNNIVDSFDKDRLLQELALLTDKIDVSEELVRLDTHTKYLHRLLKENREGGRRMDFIIQECLREITTCANKAQDVEVSKFAVDFKTELEKCREQIQNLE